jgi:hypothetical protein
MPESDFEFVEVRGVTTSFPINQLRNENATMFAPPDHMLYYFSVSSDELASARDALLTEPPSVGEVVNFSLQHPGLEVRDRAVELLSYLIPNTLRFARLYEPHDLIFRPVFANKLWEIVISALGLADETYAPFCRAWIELQVDSPNPVKALAARDALDALAIDAAGAP